MGPLSARRTGTAAVVAVLCLTPLAACSGDDDSPPPASTPSTTQRTPTTTPPTEPPTTVPPAGKHWPLTGWRANRKPPNHPVYVVKVDNTSSAAPQLGLQKADMMVEELVEGGITRLAAFYYAKLPAVVGPVRSMRASDVGITLPARAFIVASGAAPPTMKRLNEAGINRVTEGARGFFRSNIRSAPDNLMMKLPALAKHVGRAWTRPPHPYLPFGRSDDFHGTVPVTSMSVSFSGAHTTEWRLQGDFWVRTNSYAQAGHDFRVSNVLVLRVQIGDAGYLDPGGNPVPETFFFGHGAATLIHGNRAVHGIWHKPTNASSVNLTADGKQLVVPRGHTFIELIPAKGGSLTLRH